MPMEQVAYSVNHPEDTADRLLLVDEINTFTVPVRVVGSDAGSSGACTDNEKTETSSAYQFST